MLLGDLIYNNDFDVNTNVRVYKPENGKCWYECEAIWANYPYYSKPLCKYLDMKIKYITTDGDCIVIEIGD